MDFGIILYQATVNGWAGQGGQRSWKVRRKTGNCKRCQDCLGTMRITNNTESPLQGNNNLFMN